MLSYEPHLGEDITQAAASLVTLANSEQTSASMTFNDILLHAVPGMDPAALVDAYHTACEQRAEAYRASPAGQAARQQAIEAAQRRTTDLATILVHAPATMTLRDAQGWQLALSVNPDPYGHAVMTYAERWARCMEAEMARGMSLNDCAERCSHLADEEGVTGFMHGCAVSTLAAVWIHGEALRRWHNLATQLHGEGEAANASGGVLNPAILVMGEGPSA